MKKITKKLLVCMLLVGCVFTMASCVFSAGPITFISGEYEADHLAVEYDVKFSPFGKITLVSDAVIVGENTYVGKYKVDAEKKEITITWEGDAPLVISNGTSNFSYGEKDGTEYITIGIVTFTVAD